MINSTIGISNFRSFKEQVLVSNRRITLNIGPNNSGKSSYQKFFQVLQHTHISNLIAKIEGQSTFSELSTFGVGNLGTPDDFLNNLTNDNIIRWSLVIPPHLFSNPLNNISICFEYEFASLQSNKEHPKSEGVKEDHPAFFTAIRLPGIGSLKAILLKADDDVLVEIREGTTFFPIHIAPLIEDYHKILRVNINLLADLAGTEDYLPEGFITMNDLEIESWFMQKKYFINDYFGNLLSEDNPLSKVLSEISKVANDYLNEFTDSLKDIEYVTLNRFNNTRVISEKGDGKLYSGFLNYFKTRGHIHFHKLMDEILPLFEINNDIIIEPDPNSGLKVKIKDTNGKLRNIADYGSGINQLIPICILSSLNPISDLLDLGSVNENSFNPEKCIKTVFIEEPECNLHPNFQSKLADMFQILKKNTNFNFIIETHSEYLVRRFQILVSKGLLNPEDIIINYFWNPDGATRCKQIEFRKDGGLTDTFEKGFFDESLRLELDLLKVNNLN